MLSNILSYIKEIINVVLYGRLNYDLIWGMKINTKMLDNFSRLIHEQINSYITGTIWSEVFHWLRYFMCLLN